MLYNLHLYSGFVQTYKGNILKVLCKYTEFILGKADISIKWLERECCSWGAFFPFLNVAFELRILQEQEK